MVVRASAEQDDLARWQRRPVLAGLVRVVALVLPIAAGVVAGAVVGRQLPSPTSLLGFLASFAFVVALSMAAAWAVDRFSRHLLPLAALLNLSLLFPDHAPSRYRVALRSGSVRQLQRQVEAARTAGIGGDAVEAAEKIIELSATLNAHDRLTRGHAERVRAYADLLATELKLSKDDRDRLHWAALLHDVGKIFVHPHILNKPGKPDTHEWEVLRRHPEEGGKLAAPLAGWLGPWSLAIAEHHESFDGSGYPRGLAGDAISLGARIVAVADAYDVMTSARSYKRPMPAAAARAELTRCAGEQFDPAVVRAFLNIGLGRLRWAMGPLSSLFQVPMLSRLEGLAPQLGWAVRAAAGVVAVASGGLLAVQAASASPPTDVAAVSSAPAYTPLPDALFRSPAEASSPSTLPVRTDAAPVVTPVAAVISDGTAPPPPTPLPSPSPSPTPTAPPTPVPLPVAVAAPAEARPVAAPTAAPVTDLRVSGPQDQPLVLSVLSLLGVGADELDASTLAVIDGAASGSVVVDGGAGTLTYRPDPGFVGLDRVRYRMCTPAGRCGEATIEVTVLAVDHPPDARPDNLVIDEDAPPSTVAVLDNDTDADGDLDAATLAVVASPSRGVAEVRSGGIVYTPSPDLNGVDVLTYRVCDRRLACAEEAVHVNVRQVNDPPVVRLAAVQVAEDAGSVVAPYVVTADPGPPDEAGQRVTFSAVTVGDPSLLSGAATLTPSSGDVRFTTAADRWGTTDLVVTASDASGATVTVSAALVITPVNDVPIARADTATTPEDTPVTVDVVANDSDVDGDVLAVVGGSVTFTPPPDVSGTFTVGYTVADGHGGTASATVTITVTAVDDPPTFTPGSDLSVDVTGGSQTFPAWATGVGAGPPDEAAQPLTFTLTPTDPSLFTTTGPPTVDAGGTLRFTPSGILGRTAVTVSLSDGTTSTAPATFSITLRGTLLTHAVISEYAASSPTSNEDEFVELFNPTATDLDLSGYRVAISVADGKFGGITTLPPATILPSGGHVLLGGKDFDGPGAADQLLLDRIDTAGGVALQDPLGNAIDQVGAASATTRPGGAFREGAGLPDLTDQALESYARLDGGCVDTDDNAVDFDHVQTAAAITPQGSGDATTPCTGIAPPPPARTATGVVVSEVRSAGPAGSQDEFVELFNAGDVAANLNGWRIAFQDGNNEADAYGFGAVTLAPGQHLLVVGRDWTGDGLGVDPDARYGGASGGLLGGVLDLLGLGTGSTNELRDKGSVNVYDASSRLVDSVGFDLAEPGGEGQRLLRLGGGSDSYERRAGDGLGSCVDTGNNATDFRHRLGGPGYQNRAAPATPCV